MSLLSRPRLVLLEIAAAAALVAAAFEGLWLVVGAVVAVVCIALALVSVRRRPLYVVIQSWLAMRSRRSRLRGQGIASLVDDSYEVVTVPSASGGVALGAIRDATTWSVPLGLPLAGVFNDDAPIPLDRLATLLTVEDVPLASVRVVTMTAPATRHNGPLDGPVVPAARLATRHLVLTLDTVYAADVIAQRGGQAAIHQILRRCVLRAEEVLTSAGVDVRRLPEKLVAMDSASCLGPVSPGPDGSPPTATESLSHVNLDATMAKTFTVHGDDALAKLDQVVALLPAPIVATSVVLRPGASNREPLVSVLLRISGSSETLESAESALRSASRDAGLRVDAVSGEQIPMLRATTLLGVPMEVAA